MATPENNKNQLQIQLRPDMADGKYSNLAMIGHGPNEFLIDFIFAAPGMPQAPVVSRVIMSPENAKQLMFAITDNVKKYEAQFGEILPRGNNNTIRSHAPRSLSSRYMTVMWACTCVGLLYMATHILDTLVPLSPSTYCSAICAILGIR